MSFEYIIRGNTKMTENQNTFEKLEKEGVIQDKAEAPKPAAISTPTEIDMNELSDVAVGEKQKYVREDLNGQTLKVKSFQLFKADDKTERQTAMNNKSIEYCACTVIITYDAKNADDIYHREYLSGARQFVQKDGSLSEVSFWYPNGKSQVATLWETVAKHLDVKPEELSPRTFYTFLNSGVKAKIAAKSFQFPGSPAVNKNVVGEFIKE